MRSFFLASLASLAVLKSATAHPHPHNHGPYSITKRAVNLDSFRLKVSSTYKNATDVESDPSMPVLSRRASTEETATELVQKTAPDATFRLVESYVATNGMEHFYFKQTVHDIPVDSADFNVNVSLSQDFNQFDFWRTVFVVAAIWLLTPADHNHK
jgi:extracellular elastinolytic metalloproteinase